jgi:selT/selW/selH-like putative selenoprotein
LRDELIKVYPKANVSEQKAAKTTGEFEVLVDGKLIFSKLESKRFPTVDELVQTIGA